MTKAVDRAGNESAWLKQPLRFSNKAPVITEVAKYPEADVWTKDGVGVTVTAEDEVCTNLQYSFDGGRTWQSSPTGTFNANQTLNAGTIQAKNEAGFISAYGYAVEITNVDTTPPTINSIGRDTTQPTRGKMCIRDRYLPVRRWQLSVPERRRDLPDGCRRAETCCRKPCACLRQSSEPVRTGFG